MDARLNLFGSPVVSHLRDALTPGRSPTGSEVSARWARSWPVLLSDRFDFTHKTPVPAAL
ncbi:hypothetical protein [Actinomadura sp. 6N118]|uniref:hypothetical protein n=1 Tax=Actinomadura sp. 6N118 TaxID=3375151 RepID=UPI0037A2A2B6